MNPVHAALALTAVVLAAGAAVVDRSVGPPVAFISAPELADRIMGGDQTLRVFDLRAAGDFDAFHVPTAQRLDTDTHVVCESRCRGTVDHAVIIRKRQRQDQARRKLPAIPDRSGLRAAHAEDGDFRRVDDGREISPADAA